MFGISIDVSSDNCLDISSDVGAHILSDISVICSGVLGGVYSDMFFGNQSDICSGDLFGIDSDIFGLHLIFLCQVAPNFLLCACDKQGYAGASSA